MVKIVPTEMIGLATTLSAIPSSLSHQHTSAAVSVLLPMQQLFVPSSFNGGRADNKTSSLLVTNSIVWFVTVEILLGPVHFEKAFTRVIDVKVILSNYTLGFNDEH